MRAPIVVGTPFKMLAALRGSSPRTLDTLQVRYCVIDEVDKVLAVQGKYAAANEVLREAKEKQENPAALLLSALIQTQPASGMQVVAVSATVGRPLRRELFRMLQGGEGFGEMTVIRPEGYDAEEKAGARGALTGSTRQIGIPKTIS